VKPGDVVPDFSLTDQNGKTQTLSSLRGPKGLMLVFYQSADWCTYCKTQLVEMDQNYDELRKQGLGLAAISYDSPAILKNFAERRKIRYPLLSDADSAVIRAFGVLNEKVEKSNAFFGIPHPVTFVTDAGGKVKDKYFEQSAQERQTLAGLLVRNFGVAAGAAGSSATAKHVKLGLNASTGVVRSGQRVALVVEVEIPKGYHLYAPGVDGYIAVDWSMTESPLFRSHEVSYPASRILYLKAIDEKVPVYEGRARLVRDVTIGAGKGLTIGQDVKIEGTFKYQACSDRLCYPPETVPLTWVMKFEGHDTVRVPAELQKLK
jgi:peroxiredoxin